MPVIDIPNLDSTCKWYFIILVPIVGIILWIVWVCRDSDPGSNFYGDCPK